MTHTSICTNVWRRLLAWNRSRSSFYADMLFMYNIYMLFTGREVRIGKNCARGLEYGPRPQAEGHTQDRGHSFSQYGPTKTGK